MAARITVERILRDDDDDAGQSIREWKIEAEAGFITIRPPHGFLILRPADVEAFAADLGRAKEAAVSLSTKGGE